MAAAGTMALFVGATFTATSVAITAAVLLEFNLVKDPVAQTILGAAVVDDVLGLIVLSVVVGTSAGRVSALDLAILLAEAVGFLAIGMAAGVYVFRRIVLRIQVEGKRLGLPHSGFLVAMAITFLFTLTAESIGLSAVVGAFLFVLILVTILPTPLCKRALRAVERERRPAGESSSDVTETKPRGG